VGVDAVVVIDFPAFQLSILPIFYEQLSTVFFSQKITILQTQTLIREKLHKAPLYEKAAQKNVGEIDTLG